MKALKEKLRHLPGSSKFLLWILAAITVPYILWWAPTTHFRLGLYATALLFFAAVWALVECGLFIARERSIALILILTTASLVAVPIAGLAVGCSFTACTWP